MIFNIAGNLLASIFWGVLIAVLLTVALFKFPKMMYTRYSHTLAGGILLCAGFAFFTFQATLCVGGGKLKGYIPTVQQIEQTKIVTGQADALYSELITRYPGLEPFVGKAVMEKQTFASTTEAITFFIRLARKKINHYMWRRVAWIAGGCLLLGVYFANNASKQSRMTIATRHRRISE
jgi:predicted PurR-regulated permease PerM